MSLALVVTAGSLAFADATETTESVTLAAATTVATGPAVEVSREYGARLPIRVVEAGVSSTGAVVLAPSRVFGDAASRARDALAPADLSVAATRALVASAPAAQSAAPVSLPEPPPEPNTAGPSVDCTAEKCIALTFDDGPVPETADLLDLLADKGARATFFVLGTRVDDYPEIVERMAAEGHAVGNHTMGHPRLPSLGKKPVSSELSRTSDRIEDVTGERPALMRPPYGATNGTVAAVAKDLGMAQILWSVDPQDWKDRHAEVIADRVAKQATNGAIVLSHDLYASTRDAYEEIIDELLADGYALVTIPELLGDVSPGKTYSRQE